MVFVCLLLRHSHGNHTPDSDDHAEATALVEQRPSEESENGVIVVSDSAEACQDRESLRVEIDMAEVKVGEYAVYMLNLLWRPPL